MQQSKSKLFLIELIIMILFFAVASAVCMNIFARAKLASQKSTETTMAALLCQQAAEAFKATDGNEGRMMELLDATEENGRLVVGYDEAFAPVAGGQGAAYRMEIGFSGAGGVREADITMLREADTVYRLQAAQYVGAEGI
ncbi:hypothetical protein [Christensenella timonensis]|uniref:hypothetical protein n=1 Tax=Christensenella timonensis TaxID=1816678 RepID=UPI0008300A45|nr:hypothetical protein [Christensenella timonensis]